MLKPRRVRSRRLFSVRMEVTRATADARIRGCRGFRHGRKEKKGAGLAEEEEAAWQVYT
jgi:hypothetical protein